MSLLIYHKGTGTYFNADDEVFLINTLDMDYHQLAELQDGNDDILSDFVETSAATPFWEALDPFEEHPDNPNIRER